MRLMTMMSICMKCLQVMSKMKRARMKKCKNLYMIDKPTIGLTTNEQRTI